MKSFAIIALAACAGPSKPDTATKTTETTKTSTTTTHSLEAPEASVQVKMRKEGLSKDQVREVMRAHLDAVKACYETRLGEQPALEGTLTMGFMIESDGAALDAKWEGEPFDAKVGECVAAVIAGIKFPANAGRTEVTYPFVFKGDKL